LLPDYDYLWKKLGKSWVFIQKNAETRDPDQLRRRGICGARITQ